MMTDLQGNPLLQSSLVQNTSGGQQRILLRIGMQTPSSSEISEPVLNNATANPHVPEVAPGERAEPSVSASITPTAPSTSSPMAAATATNAATTANDGAPSASRKRRSGASGTKQRAPRPRKDVSVSAGSPQEQARAVNQKAKRSNLLMTNRHFTLGKEIGVFGPHEFHVDVQCISNDKSSETVVIKQGTYISLLQRAEPVRVFVAFTATNGTQARLFVRGDNEAGDPYPVSVLDVVEIVTDTPPGPQFWPAVNEVTDSRRKCELEKQEQRKEARGAKTPPSKRPAIAVTAVATQGVKKEATARVRVFPQAKNSENQALLQEYCKRNESLEARVKELEKQLEQKNAEIASLYAKMLEQLCSLVRAPATGK